MALPGCAPIRPFGSPDRKRGAPYPEPLVGLLRVVCTLSLFADLAIFSVFGGTNHAVYSSNITREFSRDGNVMEVVLGDKKISWPHNHCYRNLDQAWRAIRGTTGRWSTEKIKRRNNS
jgi:hypothetical protein